MGKINNDIETWFNKFLKENNYLTDKNVLINKNKVLTNGHYATNYAILAAKNANKAPMELAQEICDKLMASKSNKYFKKITCAKPGFINFWINNKFLNDFVDDSLAQKQNYGKQKTKKIKYDLEIVSANPTGWLHIGHARNGIIGDSFARLLRYLGYDVECEYYLNDAGNQINICAITIFYHYKKLLNVEIDQPKEIYGGDMYLETAKKFLDLFGDQYKNLKINYEANTIADEKVHEIFKEKCVELFMNDIKEQMEEVSIHIDRYNSEKEMYNSKAIDNLLAIYKEKNATYEKDGALWLKTTQYGDDKDRVLIKSDGTYTYMLPDLASHNQRFKRSKAQHYINYWGGDHHGYIQRIIAGLKLLGDTDSDLKIEIIQMVRLVESGREIKISKRKGTAIWMKDIVELIGVDALRYMLNSKAQSSHLDFDLDVIKSHSSINPIYYIQYCTSRCHQILKKTKIEKLDTAKKNNYEFNDKEIEILLHIEQLPNILEYAKDSVLTSPICDFAYGLAKLYHSYYSDTKIIGDDIACMNQRIKLTQLVYNTISICLNLLGVSVKNKM